MINFRLLSFIAKNQLGQFFMAMLMLVAYPKPENQTPPINREKNNHDKANKISLLKTKRCDQHSGIRKTVDKVIL